MARSTTEPTVQPAALPSPVAHAAPQLWRSGRTAAGSRALPEEVAVALTYDRVSFAVMMASPADLEDFALGFSLSEGIVQTASDITDLTIVAVEAGIECRMSLAPARRQALEQRRRRIAGPVGCGLCGLDSLEQAVRPLPKLHSSIRLTAETIAAGMARMAALQAVNRETRAVHAAAFLAADGEMLLREDIGRHNALDKLIGAATRAGAAAGAGALLLTSRVSLDLIQKAATFGAPLLVAVSVPSARAVREAEAAGITLIAVARDDGFEVFSHPERVIFAPV